ncbi:hypothetical protein WICPIJ_003559 [Wickerhamomyces pijperi]|uniref:Association with the SNF1 complex (ASC) domain-containing protein n=1 Tax=Wickerhamomyces pijperi TaxID=599730 RepID=A0A9P8TNQ9_WICPI|nr:hypothetical protein WICPIJ_003559 [Wickerhamomyces pijperi]
MGNNTSQQSQQQRTPLRRSSTSQRSSRQPSQTVHNELKPALEHKELISPVDVKAKPTSSVSKITTNNLFLDNIIDNGEGSAGFDAFSAPRCSSCDEGEVIETTFVENVECSGGGGDYFDYKLTPSQNRNQEINNELSLPANENDDALFDDDAIYTPGFENEGYLRETVIVQYTDPTLTSKDTVAMIGNFTHTNTQISNDTAGQSPTKSVLFPNKIKLVPFLSESKVKYFHTDINLPIGIYKCKFLINNKQARISNDMAIATDKSGNVVNWFEVKPKTNRLQEYYNNAPKTSSSRVGMSLLASAQSSRSNDILNSLKGNNSTVSSFNLTLTKEKLQYSKEIPELYIPFIPNLNSDTEDPNTDSNSTLAEIDPQFLEKHPIPELPIYLNNSYLNKQFNQQHNSGNHTPNGGNHPQGNSIMKGLNFHIIPHVNLNHLLTSNIKNNVLTVACTTRYHGKFVTQIMYSPTHEDSNME